MDGLRCSPKGHTTLNSKEGIVWIRGLCSPPLCSSASGIGTSPSIHGDTHLTKQREAADPGGWSLLLWQPS